MIFPRTESKDIYDEIYLALSQLKDSEKISLLLFEVGGFTIEEITEIQGERSQSAVKSRLSRVRKKLKRIIENLESGKGKMKIYRPASIDNLEIETINIINNIKPGKKGG